MAAPPAAAREIVIDLFVLALSRTSMRDVVAPEALKTVMSAEYSTLVHDGAFELKPIWDLLRDQPGFEAKAAFPAIFFFKSLEPRLGMTVRLPQELEDVIASERATYAALCPVKREEVDRIFDPSSAPAAAAPRPRPRASLGGAPAAAPAPRGPASAARRKKVLVVCSALIALSLLVVTLSLLGGRPSLTWQAVPAASVSGLPAKEARKLGRQLSVVVADEGWFAQAAEVREEALLGAFRQASAGGVDVLIVEDAARRTRATVQRHGGGEARVRLYR